MAPDTRNLKRESLLLMAELAVEGRADACRVKVRNLSDGGMMAEGDFQLARGERVTVRFQKIGDVRGVVAWCEGNRAGIAFDHEIDSMALRPGSSSNGSDSQSPRHTRTPSSQRSATRTGDRRKV